MTLSVNVKYTTFNSKN